MILDALFVGVGGRETILAIQRIHSALESATDEQGLKEASEVVKTEMTSELAGAILTALTWGAGRAGGKALGKKVELNPDALPGGSTLSSGFGGASRKVNRYTKGKTPLEGSRKTGVSRARALEVELVRKTGKGTADWTAEEIAFIKREGRLPDGIVGHHINSVAEYPDWAGDPRNIKFVRGQGVNLNEHGGVFQNPTTGPLIDRQAKINSAAGAQQ